MKKVVLSAMILAVSAAYSFAQIPSMMVGADPASAALAGASVAGPATAFAAEINPAAMALAGKTMAAELSYGNWKPSSGNVMGAGAWVSVGERAALGISGKYVRDSEMALTNNVGAVDGTYAPADAVANVAVAYKITDFLSLGVAGKFVNSSLTPEVSGNAFGADLSVAFAKGPVSASLGAYNLGSSINYGSSSSVSMPMMAKLGAACSFVGLTASLEADYVFLGGLMAALGVEYSIKDIAFLRAGYHYGSGDHALPSFASVGAGFKFAGVELNAAYLLASDVLGGTFQIGLGYSF